MEEINIDYNFSGFFTGLYRIGGFADLGSRLYILLKGYFTGSFFEFLYHLTDRDFYRVIRG